MSQDMQMNEDVRFFCPACHLWLFEQWDGRKERLENYGFSRLRRFYIPAFYSKYAFCALYKSTVAFISNFAFFKNSSFLCSTYLVPLGGSVQQH